MIVSEPESVGTYIRRPSPTLLNGAVLPRLLVAATHTVLCTSAPSPSPGLAVAGGLLEILTQLQASSYTAWARAGY
jgi:hypothetical protein